MKADINRRAAISGLALLPTLAQTLLPSFAQAQGSQAAPLASWNDGPAKQAIIDFVRATTDQTGSKFVPAEDRVATFDQDGTLWVEHPCTRKSSIALSGFRPWWPKSNTIAIGT